MAIRVNKKHKTIMDKMPDVIRSEYKFRNLILAGVMAGMLSVTEPKGKQKKHPHHFHNRPVKWAEHGDIGYEQYWNLDRTNGLFVPRVTTLFSNGSATAAKLTFINNVRIAHAPLRELNEASERTSKMMTVLDTTKMLQLKEFGSSELHAVMATFTIPNCDKGTLDDAISEMSKLISKLVKALKDASNNQNGLQLYDDDGNPVQFVGALMTIEVTINQKKLHSMDPDGLFHPHVHLVLLTSDDLDEIDGRKRLFNYWQGLNSNYVLSPDAFNLEHAYDNGETDDARIVSEATKYAAKPSMYKILPTIKNTQNMKTYDQFSLETFVELFKAIKGRQLKRNYGLLLEATGFINWITDGVSVKYQGNDPRHPDNERINILNAIMSGSFDESKVHVPDIMTNSYTVKPTGGYERLTLSDDEMIYANSLLLQGSTWEMPANIKWPNNKKADTYKWLLEHFVFIKPGVAGLIDQADTWLQALDRRMNWVHYHVLDPDEKLDKTIKIRKQIDDVHRWLNMLNTIESIEGPDATTIQTHDYHAVYKHVSLMQLMDAHHAKLVRDNNNRLTGVTFDKPDVEKQLVQTYSSDDDPLQYWNGSTSFLPYGILQEYAFWQRRTLQEFKDDRLQHVPIKTIDLVSKMDSRTMQKWLDKSLKVKPKKQLSFHQMFAAGSPQNPSLTDDKLDELCNLFDDGTAGDTDELFV